MYNFDEIIYYYFTEYKPVAKTVHKLFGILGYIYFAVILEK